MSDSFMVQVCSDKALVFEGEASMVLLPTTEGQVGILANHIPYFAQITAGDVVIKNGNEVEISVSDGYCSVFDNILTVFDAAKNYELGYTEEDLELIAGNQR
jgi:F-type H+-transporting ATPase subunit epsilon